MDLSPVLSFLNELKQNNNREWFQENKDKYQKARQQVIDFTDELIKGIKEFDPDIGLPKAKDCLFRIYRDVRFSKDKSPYKTNFGSFISKGGRKGNYAGYYLHLEPDGSFLGGGIYMPAAPALKAVRNEIYFNPSKFLKIVEDEQFKKYFDSLSGEKLKRPPQGFPKDFSQIEYLKYKSYIVSHNVDDKTLLKSDFVSCSLDVFKTMHKLNAFINRGIDMAES